MDRRFQQSEEATDHPTVFYKYTLSETAVKILDTRRIRWSSPLIFDDPAEFRRMPCFKPTLSDAIAEWRTIMVRAALGEIHLNQARLTDNNKLLIAGIHKLLSNGTDPKELISDCADVYAGADTDALAATRLREFFSDNRFNLKTARILCVTAKYDNPAMWAHYAEENKGCVLGFRSIQEQDTPLLEARPVAYSEEPPIVDSFLDLLLYGRTEELVKNTLDAICYTKHASWSYQREWRVITWRPEESEALYGDYKFFPEELACVTLGIHSTEATEAAIRSCLHRSYPQCPMFRMQLENGKAIRIEI